MSQINIENGIFFIEDINTGKLSIHYIKGFDHYIYTILKDSYFWESNHKYFQNDFNLLKNVLVKCLIRKDFDNISYQLTNHK